MTIKTPEVEIELKQKNNEKENPEIDVDFDELLSSAGELGIYQILLFSSTILFYMFGVFVYFGQIFMTEVSPKHWCWVPELQGLEESERITLAIPPDENERFGINQCYQYAANWTEVLITGIQPNSTWGMIPCQHGWEFDQNGIPYPTISSELGWVCENRSFQASAQSIFFLGSIFGGLTIGWIADKYGRLPAAVISNVVGAIGGIASTFATNFIQFSICRFIVGIAYDNCMIMAYLIVLEYVAPKYRSLLSNITFALFYCFFCSVLPWIALACGSWQIISLVTSVPMLLAIFTPLFFPESPRWLLSKGRINDAINKILVIGRINNKEVPSKLIDQFKSTLARQNKQETGSWLQIFNKPILRRTFIKLCLLYMVCTLVFDAIIRGIGVLEFDFFISFTLLAATELPSLLILAFILDWTGRRWTTAISLFITGILCVLSVFIGSSIGSVACAVIARFAVNMSFSACMQWTPEVLPTLVRGSGNSIVHICGFVATLLSPYIVYLHYYSYWLPMVITGAIACFGGVLALFLPETGGIEMPHTFDDADKLCTSQKFFDMPCLRKKVKEFDGTENMSFECD